MNAWRSRSDFGIRASTVTQCLNRLNRVARQVAGDCSDMAQSSPETDGRVGVAKGQAGLHSAGEAQRQRFVESFNGKFRDEMPQREPFPNADRSSDDH